MKLGKVFKLSSGKSLPEKKRSPGNHNVYGGNGITGKHNDYFMEKPTIVIGRVGEYCGVVHLTTEKCWITDNALMVTEWYQEVDKQYLVYVLNAMNLNQYAKTVGQPSISQANVYGLDIDLPLMEHQQEIVKILNMVSKIIIDRKEELKRLDDLIKARFIELFGNLVIGDKIDTNKKKIGEIASVTKLAGFEFTKYIQYKEHGDIIMLRGLNCKKGHLVLDDVKWIDKETSDLLPRSKLYYGDILMTYAGTIGDVAMVDADDKYHLAPNVAKITLNDKNAYNPIFLMHLFMYTNDYIMTFASVVAQASINMEKIRNFEYYFPPIELQNQFAAFVKQVDKSKFVA